MLTRDLTRLFPSSGLLQEKLMVSIMRRYQKCVPTTGEANREMLAGTPVTGCVKHPEETGKPLKKAGRGCLQTLEPPLQSVIINAERGESWGLDQKTSSTMAAFTLRQGTALCCLVHGILSLPAEKSRTDIQLECCCAGYDHIRHDTSNMRNSHE